MMAIIHITYYFMSLLQIQVDDKLKEAIVKKAKSYDVPISSLVKIVLTKTFLSDGSKGVFESGNVFNADRDNKGKGISLDALINAL